MLIFWALCLSIAHVWYFLYHVWSMLIMAFIMIPKIILTSNYLVPNCPSANLSWCQNFPDTKLSWPQIFLVLICLQSNRADKLSWCQIVWCYIVMVPNWLGAKLSSTKLSCCQIVWCQISLVPFVACKANFSVHYFFPLIFCIFIFKSALEWSKITKYPPWTWYNCTKYVCPLLGYLGLCQVLLIRWAL